jgi:hypothetical protein
MVSPSKTDDERTTEMAGKKKRSKAGELALAMRAAERRIAAEHDPWFGKRRKAGEMGRAKTKAEKSRQACRDRSLWV